MLVGGLIYQALNANGVVVPQGLWDFGLDLFKYVCIGMDVVSGKGTNRGA